MERVTFGAALRIAVTFIVTAIGTFYVVSMAAVLLSMAYFQARSDFDVGNSGIFVFPVGVVIGLIAAPFGGVLAVTAIERWLKCDRKWGRGT